MRKFYLFSIPFISLLILISTSCVDEIQLDPPAGFDESIVILGKLSRADKTSIKIDISQLFNFDGKTDFFPVDKVLLFNGLGNSINIPWVGDQTYFKVLNGVFPVEYGESYMIRVELENGNIVESDLSVLNELEKNNSLRYVLDERSVPNKFGPGNTKTYVQYYYKTQLSSDVETKYHHDITRTFRFTDYRKPRPDGPEGNLRAPPTSWKRKTCYVTDDRGFTDTKLLDPISLSKVLDDDMMHESMIYEEVVDWPYAEDHNFTIVQESIDQATYDYYDKITRLLSFSGGMFEPRPAVVSSNMRYLNDTDASVYGFFYATDQDTSRLYLGREAVGLPDTICLRPVVAFSSGEILSPETSCRWFLPSCCDCLVFDNSTQVKPDFWKD